MTKTTFDLAPFYRNAIGIDRLFDRLVNQVDSAQPNYPPYDIVRTGEQTYEIRLAVAGFKEGEIDVELHDGNLRISGAHTATESEGNIFHHRGIGNRSFIRSFALADYVEVNEAVLQDGILTVKLERIVPEELKPKKIAISYLSNNSK